MMDSEKLDGLFEKISKLRILVIGDVMLDHYIWGDSSRISPEAPVPVVHVGDDSFKVGGAANVAMNIRSLGGQASLVGAWSNDFNGRVLEEALAQGGIEFDKVDTSEKAPTITKTRVMARKQQVCRVDREGAPRNYIIDGDVCCSSIRECIKNVDAVILSDYSKGTISPELARMVLEESVAENVFVALDSKSGASLNLEGMDLATPNRAEALEMARIRLSVGDTFPSDLVCRKIWEEQRPNHLVITLGEDGMLLSEEGKVTERIPTSAREVYDVSGAGDTVIASLTLALVAGARLSEAAQFANAAAGVVVAKVGAAQATPEEVISHASQV